MNRTKKILFQLHVFFGFLLLANLISESAIHFALVYVVSQTAKFLFIISGIVLFFVYKKSQIKLYFSVYIFSPVVAFISLLFGLAGLFLVCLMLFIIFPKSLVNSSNDLLLYRKFSGPMKVPDSYQLSEKLFIFEKELANFKIEEEDYENFEKGKMTILKDTFFMKYRREIYTLEKENVFKDTIFKLHVN